MAKRKEKEESKNKAELFDELYGVVEDAKNNSSTWAEKANNYYRLRMRHKKTKTFPFPGCSNLRLPTIETNMRKAKAALMALFTNVKPRVMVIPQSQEYMSQANKIEQFLDWLADVKIKLMDKLAVITDMMLQHGFSLAKVTWKMEDSTYTETIKVDDLSVEEAQLVFNSQITDEQLAQFIIKKTNVDMSETVSDENMEAVLEAVKKLRAGKDNIKLTLKDELYNAPDVIPCDPT